MFINSFDKNYFLRFKHNQISREQLLFYQKQITELSEHFDKRITVCDVGCGLGFFLEICDKAGWTTFGVDISDYAIKEANRRIKARLAVGDIQEGIPFDDMFDVITCFDVLEHIKNPQRAIANIGLKLRGSGILLVTTPNLRSRIWGRISAWQEDETHISLKRPEEWVELLEMTGFKIISKKTIFPILQHKGGAKGLVGKVLAKLGFGSALYILALKEEKGKYL